MAHSLSAKKRVRQNTRRRTLNRSRRSQVKTQIKHLETTLSEGNAAAAAEGLRANVWYSLLGWRGSGLVTGDLQPLPAFDAFRFSSRMLTGAAYIRPINQFAGVRGYEFVRDGQRFWLLWSLDGAEHFLDLPVMPHELYDVFGAALVPIQSLTVSPAPLYILFPPGI